MMMTNSGTVATRMEATDDGTLSSAKVISENGSTMLSTDSTTRWPYVRRSRGIGCRVASRTPTSSAAPTASRSATRVNGVSVSSPSMMNR